MHTDQHYIEGFRCGNTVEVNKLLKDVYVKFESRIVHFIESNAGSTEEGVDIFQRCVIVIYQKAVQDQNFTLTSSIYTYLYSVARNLWFKELKKKNKVQLLTEVSEAVLMDKDTSFMELIEKDVQSQKQLLFYEKIQLVSKECRELLEAFFEEKTPDEIANIFNLTYGSYRVKKSRCVKRLTESIRLDPRFKKNGF